MTISPYLTALGCGHRLNDKLQICLQLIQARLTTVQSISVVTYDKPIDTLRTFSGSEFTDTNERFPHIECRLADSVDLAKMVSSGKPEFIFDIFTLNEFSTVLETCRSCYAFPVIRDQTLLGIVFFFSADTVNESGNHALELNGFGQLIATMFQDEVRRISTFLSIIESTLLLTHHRDPETAQHLERMSRYCQLIATKLAPDHGFDGQYIENIYHYSKFHDIGKLKIPERILFKSGRLDAEEMAIMETHASHGFDIGKSLIRIYDLNDMPDVAMIATIAGYHHEKMDGTGYPYGLQGDQIPIEARIAAVADIFDALTSPRLYKTEWNVDSAFAEISKLSGSKLDAGCANVFLGAYDEVCTIHQQFAESI